MAEDRRSTVKFPVVSEVKVEDVPVSVAPETGPLSSRPAHSVIPRNPSFIDQEWLDAETSVTRPTETSLAAHPAVAQRDRAILTVLTGLNAGQVFTLDSDETSIGRGREAGVRIDDVGMSRAHSRIVRTLDGKFVVEDLGSTNGTFVAGSKVERAELHTGDRLQVGPNVVLRFAILDAAEEQLAHQLYEASTKDGLTKVYNRKYFVERMAAEVAYAHRHKSQLSVILFDLDHFKKVNDTHGHLAGDVVLRVVAAQVQKTIRTEDVLARYGGEEFAILVRGIAHPNSARFGERVRKAVERLSIPWEQLQIKATISIGVSSLSELPETATGDVLLHLADERLYKAKSSGRNRVAST
ncbi:MAG: GGDEF domain-containing protein [Polyangiaceae bacterium]|jgi:two-component system, cell cycle response regulator